MGLLGDLKEVKAEWKSSSLSFKIIAATSFFFAVSSIASLSTVIFAWKGFFLDAIIFYRAYISHPINVIFQHLGLRYRALTIDYIILTTLINGSFIRLFWYQYYRKETSLWSSIILTVILLACFTTCLITFSGGIYQPQTYIFYVLICLFIFLPILFNYSKKEKTILYIPVIAGLFIVLFLGAISSGLHKLY